VFSVAFEEDTSSSLNATASQVVINFDTLPSNVPVAANQYKNASFAGSGTVSTAYDAGLGGSYPNGIIATSGAAYSFWPTENLYVNFPIPVNGLSFRVLGAQGGGCSFMLEVYVNNSLYQQSWFSTGSGYPGQTFQPITINLSGIAHITAVRLLYISNYDYWYNSNYVLYYDDFTFTPEVFANIITPRVNGGLDQTTQNAMPGADILLQASTSHGGGAYSWTFTPSNLVSIVSGTATSSSLTIRTLDTGSFNAKLTYTLNGVSMNPSLTINSVLPTVTSFTGQRVTDRINSPGQCNQHLINTFWWYEVGCPNPEPGMTLSAEIRAPTSFISDPIQSGVKFVQAISIFQKKMQRGLSCNTRRTSEANIDSGWQLDGDPLSTEFGATMYFSVLGSGLFPGSSLSIGAHDSPGNALTGFVDADFVDAVYEDDRFETYVVYFADHNQGQPFLQRPIGRLRWNWGGLVVFDENTPGTYRHRLRFTNSIMGTLTGEATTAPMVSMQGNWSGNPRVPCAGGPPVSFNAVDSSRQLVKEYYQRILGRPPDGMGWDGWTGHLAQCVFDLDCNVARRSSVALGFFWSPEFIQQMNAIDPQTGLPVDSVMANPPGSQNFDAGQYNPRFVHWCYQKFLNRDEDPGGLAWYSSYLNSSGDYAGVVYAFIYSNEYRNQIPRMP
jgi:hypothetical protein